MKQIPADALRGLALNINAELERLRRLAGDVAKLRGELRSIRRAPRCTTRTWLSSCTTFTPAASASFTWSPRS